ncbi:MAG: T9SS-dependent M36 family metallopeptidase [Flavobacteriales bacterium]|nr:T9SS-dependent M36 family metallopeptidase [Flavobacteriales bacterium]
MRIVASAFLTGVIFIGFHTLSLAQISPQFIQRSVQQAAAELSVSPDDASEYIITDNYTRKSTGTSHVYVSQTLNGFEIFNAQMQLHFDKNQQLVAKNSRFVKNKKTIFNASVPVLSPSEALYAALRKVGITSTVSIKIETTSDPNRVLLINEDLFHRPVRATLGYDYVNGKLVLAYRLFVEPKATHDMFNIRVDAINGEIIGVNNRTLSCQFDSDHTHAATEFCSQVQQSAPEKSLSSGVYNAFPLGIESPNHGTRQLLSGVEFPPASPFGWHDENGIPGAEYTITRGNNVHAYEDENDSDIPGYSPDGGAGLVFDFPLNFTQTPQSNMDAAITNLFVWNNYLHDISYFYGFDEESGNFQQNNYNNGGQEFDYVEAQGFDGGGTNNANFGTPEDGFNPRMQMYLWYSSVGQFFTVNTPASIAGPYNAAGATFGPPVPTVPITADLVLANDGSVNPSQGCGTLLNAASMNGKIAVFDRGTCTFVQKALNAQNAGAVAVIIINNQGTEANSMGGNDNGQVNIPVISLSLPNGTLIKNQMSQTTVNGSVGGAAASSVFDSNFDNGVISHEYGHGISNRLTAGPSNVDCLFNEEQAGEGWSDFFGLILSDMPGSSANDGRGIGTFVSNQSTTGGGIRPYKYSRDMTVNPLTYADIDGLSIPHGVGSVWCTMIWDLYWNLAEVYGHSYNLYSNAGGNNIAIRLVMEGMRLQPCFPGFVDSRDAILQADQLLYNGVHSCIIWKTFARRGLGFSASQGSSDVVGDETEAFDLPAGCSFSDEVDFYADKTDICTDLPVQFQQLVLPGATSYAWSFPGGTPVTSILPSPTVTYSTPGVYSVSLTAINANGSQTFTKTAYITVTDGIDFQLALTPSDGVSGGSATVTQLSGVGPYSYSWSGFPNESGPTLSNLSPGNYQVTVSNADGCSSTSSFTIVDVSSISGTQNHLLSVFPNPARDVFFVKSFSDPVSNIQITDIKGKQIQSLDFSSPECAVSTQELAAGMYLIHIRIGETTHVKRIVVQK